VVKFKVDNSLGKLYLEMYPDSRIKDKYKIANAPIKQTRMRKPLTEIRFVDLATGSGNYLFYAFDLFYDLYMDQIDNYGADYDEDEIPKLIIENNLYGIDIDNRAIQIAQLGLYIKAMRKKRNIHIEKFNVVSSDFILPAYEDVSHLFKKALIDRETEKMLKEIWGDLQMAHKFGSLVRIEEKVEQEINRIKEVAKTTTHGLGGMLKKWENWKQTFVPEILKAVDESSVNNGETFLRVNTKAAFTYLSILTSKHDVAVCNPPYTDSSDFGPELKKFINANYKQPFKFNSNLYACFIKRCFEVIDDKGKMALIHPLTFMYIKSFEDVRKLIIDKMHINILVEFGMGGLFPQNIFVDPAFYVLESKEHAISESVFVSLDQYSNTFNQTRKKEFLLKSVDDYKNEIRNKHLFTLSQSKLKIIDGWPFIYWISDEFREKFKGECLDDIANATVGINSGGNERFLRFHWEVDRNEISLCYSEDRKKWVGYAKGGPFNKWYGNNWLRVNWENDGSEIRNAPKSIMRNSEFYFREGITYSASGSKGVSFRYLSNNNIFDVGGSSIFLKKESEIGFKYFLGYLNSKLCGYITDCLNPTVNIQVGDLKRIPVVRNKDKQSDKIEELVSINIGIKKHINQFSISEIEFTQSPFYRTDEFKLKPFLNYENHLFTQVFLNEAIINEKIFEVYELSPADRAMVLAKEGESIGGLPVNQGARAAYLSDEEATKEFTLDNIRGFVEALPEKEFTAEEREAIENEFPSLYQSHHDLEAFCIRNQVNPINVWYWFKENNIIPKQRMNDIAMEFLADLIREILMEDGDGIAPLVSLHSEM
jgi:hypothetical protein